MSIELSDLTSLVGDTAAFKLTAPPEAVTAAIHQVEQEHPGYSYSYSTEIRCDSYACSRFMEIKVGPGHSNAATEAFAAHRAERVDALLAEWFPAPEDEDLGN